MSLAAVAALVLYCNKPEAPPELIPQYSLEWDKEYKGTMLGPGDAKPPAGCEARYHIDGAITARLCDLSDDATSTRVSHGTRNLALDGAGVSIASIKL